MITIELGGGNVPIYHPNIDINSSPSVDIIHDLTKGIPLPDNHADFIYSRDFIEHLSFSDFISLLVECKRILKARGKIEFVTPDVYKTVFQWNGWNEHTHHMVIGDFTTYGSSWDSGNLALRHKMWFTPELLKYIFETEGWLNIEISEFKQDSDFWKEPKIRIIAEK